MQKPNAAEPDPPGTRASWIRAVRFATSAAEVAEALSGILSSAAGAAGAAAGAILEAQDGSVRAAWRCGPAEILSRIRDDEEMREAASGAEEWSEKVRVFDRAGECDGVRYGHVLLTPVRLRGLSLGLLALLYEAGAPPGRGERAAAVALAGLVALVLENDRLYEEAREALQARDHFLTALNHELRTPATSLLLIADMLRSGVGGDLPPRLQRMIQEAEEHVREMVAVLRRVLDLGRASSEAAPEEIAIIQPRQAVLKLLQRVEPAAKRKGLTLSLHVPRNLPAIQTDVPRFSQILLHLLSNAIKYTTHGGVEVRLERTLRRLSGEKQEPVLLIHVRDSGRGIPQPELDRIFEPFAQVDEGARTDSRTRGLGLGLPLARQLARSLGGDITLESELGRGTVASLLLPYRSPFGG